jgi:hypothetical protein
MVEHHSTDPDDKTVYGLLTGKPAATIAAIRRTGVTGISRGIDYIGLMLTARTTLPHFSVSVLARVGRAGTARLCRLSVEDRKTFARSEPYRF